MNIFGNEEEEPQTENTRVISNSLGIDLGTLNTVIVCLLESSSMAGEPSRAGINAESI